MQQVGNWNLLDLFPIEGVAGLNEADPAIVEVFAGLNLWGYVVKQGGNILQTASYPYGELANQFNELATLWSTYRIDNISIEWKPSQTGAGYHSPIASCIDPAGAVASLSVSSYQDLVTTFSRLRSMRL